MTDWFIVVTPDGTLTLVALGVDAALTIIGRFDDCDDEDVDVALLPPFLGDDDDCIGEGREHKT